MKFNRIQVILATGLSLLLFLMVTECMAFGPYRGFRSNPSPTVKYPAAVYYADVEGGYPYRHTGRVDMYEDDYALILPSKGNSPFQYRKWNKRMTYGTGAINFGTDFGGYDGYSTGAARNPLGTGVYSGPGDALNYPEPSGRGIRGRRVGAGFQNGILIDSVDQGVKEECIKESVPQTPSKGSEAPAEKKTKEDKAAVTKSAANYSVSPTAGYYNQEFGCEGCSGGFVSDGFVSDGGFYGDVGFYEEAIPARRGCALLQGIKNLFGHGRSCVSRLFGRNRGYATGYLYDPCFPCDPCFGGWSTCCDPCYTPCCTPCCDPCCNPCDGAFFSSSFVGTGAPSCCGASSGDVYSSTPSYGVTNDINTTTLPGPAGSGRGVDASVTQQPTPVNATQPSVIQTNPQPNANPSGQRVMPVQGGQPGVLPNNSAPQPRSTTTPPGTSGMIQMSVPEDSVVFVNGYQTHMTGTERNFTANNLIPGEIYDFEIKVLYSDNGEPKEMVKNTSLIPGSTSYLAFDVPLDSNVRTVALNKK